ncbi:hypothetical protein HIM_07163 [Hirsutella minnesotensis 3608]|uniref:Amino acid transporter transmembrane domain-containing protein n=1 Tax=Hirsutella minnesotensis 3608 TaxID=1043627 RepID=A0A0F8A4D1_9HYPO|nr:hypothetical protein HIM_07163 [Hirsutella minnesotensis 3608]
MLAQEQALLDDDDGEEHGFDGDDDDDATIDGSRPRHFARRRSSISNRLASVADIGGVNSFRSFARSWQRAASFAEVIPRRPSLVLFPDQTSTNDPGRNGAQQPHFLASSPQQQLASPASYTASSLRHHLQRPTATSIYAQGEPSAGADPGADLVNHGSGGREDKYFDAEMASGALPIGSPSGRSSIFATPPHLAAPSVIGSYGSFRNQYGTMSSRRSRPSFSQGSGWTVRPDVDGAAEGADDEDAALGEDQPILVKEVKQGNKIVLTVEGQSTLPQSVFNSINALIGVGLLSLPLALKMSGWIIGLGLLTLMAAVATHTGKLLGRCMRVDASLITYSDLAYVSFGPRARLVVSVLFTLELIGACVALMILFADSLDLLLPGFASVNAWKCVCAALVLVLNTFPLRWLSYTSVVGIFSTFGIVCIVIANGLLKRDTPGSLWEPASTHLLPTNWLSVPLAYGLLASPWGAHCVFPSIYRDMRHPHKWEKGVNVAFSFSYALDTCLAIVGILMFGDGIRDAITSNILKTPGYPEAPKIVMSVFIAIIPLTKIPLNSRPLITTADVLFGLHYVNQPDAVGGGESRSALVEACLRAATRILVVVVLLMISILFPAFDSVCAFLGSALCSLISIILPILFYLKLYSKDISARERVVSWFLLAVFSTLGLVGTVWTFVPKHLIESA